MSLFSKIGEFFTGKSGGLGGGYKQQYKKEQDIQNLYKNRFNPYEDYYRPDLTKKRETGADRFYNIGMSKELDPQAKAQLEDIRRRSQVAERGSREAIMQDARSRGASSGTGNLLSQLINQQQGADRMSREGTDVAANQWARALDSLKTGMDSYADINRDQLDRAQLQDLFDRYNLSGQADSLDRQGDLLAGGTQRRRGFLKGVFDELKPKIPFLS